MEQRIEALLAEMTVEEKVSMVAGASFWYTTPIERLGIPAMKMTDGPNGARGEAFSGSMTSACFPVGIALAATWNPDLVQEIGVALAEETQAKGAHMLLGPTVNMHRSPLNGRNFECYSEDPYLAARLAVAYVRGLQSRQVAASIKHFVCNDSEFERNTISSEVPERALREIYLVPFEAAVKEAGVWSVMAAYNKLNGTYCSEHPILLGEILKEEWGFDGFVVSDWFGTKSTVAAGQHGVDLEMPGPPIWFGEKLLEAVRTGQVTEDAITEKVRRLLRIMARTGALDAAAIQPEQAIDRSEHRQLIRRAAAEGMVLLKNVQQVLPLDRDSLQRIAVIGANARVAQIQGGGSARVRPHYVVTPLEGILAKVGPETTVVDHVGCRSYKFVPPIAPQLLTPIDGGAAHGFTIEYFNIPEPAGTPVYVETSDLTERLWIDQVAPAVDMSRFSARLKAWFTPTTSGAHTFGLLSAGLSRLYLDGELILDNWEDWQPGGEAFFGMAGQEKTTSVTLQAGQAYRLEVEYSRQGAMGLAALRVGHAPPIAENSIQQAADLAATADVALVFVGLDGDWESEGYDRSHMDLPAQQNDLVTAVAAANPRTVVVLNTGSPVTMPWLEEVAAVVQAWYPGQECGNAIADVLFGDVNPSGRLPQTFPRRLPDNPAYIHYPGELGRVSYGEGIFVGYRYYDKKEIEPLFPFGFGLSYTEFDYHTLAIQPQESATPEEIQVSIAVTNTGQHAGQEVVQLYIKDPAATVLRPEKELKRFHKVQLAVGETQTITFDLDHRALAYYHPDRQGWMAEAGEYEVLIGASSRDIRACGTFVLTRDHFVPNQPAASAPPALSVQSPLRDLLADDEARAILLQHFPELLDAPQLSMALGFTLQQLAGLVPDVVTEEKIQAIATALAESTVR